MPVAYVLINTEVGAEREVLEKLREIPEVVEAYIVFGIYDVIAKVSVDRQELLGEVVTNKLRRLEKVRHTLTIIAVEGFERCQPNCT
ncbi:MAG: Lrp/AsnC ligand binding domain-containing protein [Thermofilaceae archaeon]